MRAAARIVAVAGGDGRTRLAVLRGEPPLLPRRTGTWRRDGVAEVHLVGGAAGPLGGDALDLDIEVGPGAHLIVATVAASIVLPGPRAMPSVSRIRASVATGGRLEWLPEPLVAVRGCRHLASSTVELAAGAELVWRDEVICGRHLEDSGDLIVATAVRLAGAPLFHQQLAVGPESPWSTGPAALGGARATGSVLVVAATQDATTRHATTRHAATADAVTADAETAPAAVGADRGRVAGAGRLTGMVGSGATVATMRLAGPAVLTSAVAADAHVLRQALARSGHG